MGSHHHHIAANRILTRDDLRRQFGHSPTTGALETDISGAPRLKLLAEMAALTEHQWRSGVTRGLVKGFFLYGPPGTGKTTIARRLALELCDRFADEPGAHPVVMATIDGAEIARSRYGESEERIRDIFAHAKAGFSGPNQRSVVLFDDIESVFMSRDNQHAREWHFSQDSVFFHAVDDLDTSRSILILTSNRPDLVDAAIRDRFLCYEAPYPDTLVMLDIVEKLAVEQGIAQDDVRSILREAEELIAAGRMRSIREAQGFILRRYVLGALSTGSIAAQFAGETD